MSKLILIGFIVNTKNNKTFNVAVQKHIKIFKYNKYINKIKYYLVHNPSNILYKQGTLVLIEQTSPKSRNKHWILKNIIK